MRILERTANPAVKRTPAGVASVAGYLRPLGHTNSAHRVTHATSHYRGVSSCSDPGILGQHGTALGWRSFRRRNGVRRCLLVPFAAASEILA